ncbi:MAG: hypothetical protein AB7O73_02175 [Bacteroidia bacterium]
MKKSKRWLLFLIVLFPSLFWVILESSTINSRKLPYYGPKTFSGTDTSFYTVKEHLHPILTQINFPDNNSFVVMMVKKDYKKDSYRVGGLQEYESYKKEKIAHIPILFICESDSISKPVEAELKFVFKEQENLYYLSLQPDEYNKLSALMFKEKPYYIDYSFLALVDNNFYLRGYYDSRYVAEIKRMIGEYQHLRIKEEKEEIKNENAIKQNS